MDALDAIGRRPVMYVGDIRDGSGLVRMPWEVACTPTDGNAPRPSPAASVCVMMNGTGNANTLVDDVLTKAVACGMS